MRGSNPTKIILIVLITIFIGGCSIEKGELINEGPKLKDCPAIASFASETQQSVKFLGIAWQRVKDLEVPVHVDNYYEITRKSSKDYTIHTIVAEVRI